MLQLKNILTEILNEADVFAAGPSGGTDTPELFKGKADEKLLAEVERDYTQILDKLQVQNKIIYGKDGIVQKMSNMGLEILVGGDIEGDIDPDQVKAADELVAKYESLIEDTILLNKSAMEMELVLREKGGETSEEKDKEHDRLIKFRMKYINDFEKFKKQADPEVKKMIAKKEAEVENDMKATDDKFLDLAKAAIKNNKPIPKRSDVDSDLKDTLKKDTKKEDDEAKEKLSVFGDTGAFDSLRGKIDKFFTADL